jgi:TPR repeat protein
MWLEKAAAHGDVLSLLTLGMFYERGLGVVQDGARAFALNQQAADLGKKTTRRPHFACARS